LALFAPGHTEQVRFPKLKLGVGCGFGIRTAPPVIDTGLECVTVFLVGSIILPLCLETQFIWTGSLLAYIHMWKLRLKSDTQQETRDIADEMLQLVKQIDGNPFEHTLKAWGY
jgi:hypothetical protein